MDFNLTIMLYCILECTCWYVNISYVTVNFLYMKINDASFLFSGQLKLTVYVNNGLMTVHGKYMQFISAYFFIML